MEHSGKNRKLIFRIILVLAAALAVLTVMHVMHGKRQPVSGVKSISVLPESSGISAEVKSSDADSVTILLKNDSDRVLNYGADYHVLRDGTETQTSLEMYFIALGYSLEPHSSAEIVFDLQPYAQEFKETGVFSIEKKFLAGENELFTLQLTLQP